MGQAAPMGRRAIGTLMLLATLSVIGVVVIQLLWLRQASRYREDQLALNREQATQLEKQFNDRVMIALTDVTEQILSITKDPSDLYDAVKQERPNYFAVTINDTLHPYLLEALLRKEFSRRNIQEDFEYGIYDCFTDSVVYGNYVSLDTLVHRYRAPQQAAETGQGRSLLRGVLPHAARAPCGRRRRRSGCDLDLPGGGHAHRVQLLRLQRMGDPAAEEIERDEERLHRQHDARAEDTDQHHRPEQ